MTSAPSGEDRSGRELSAFDLGCVVVGGIVGIGIFFTPGTVARRVDSTAEMLLAWGIGGALAVFGALVFADLAARVPGHGGVFRYLHAAFGRWPAFLFGWANWLVVQSGAQAVVALLFVEHVERAVRGQPVLSPHLRVAFGAATILFLMATNLLGLRVGKRVQNALVVGKLFALGFLVVAAATATGAPAPSTPPESAGGTLLTRMGAAMLPVLFAIGGWQQGSFVAGAARRPRRDVPLGVLGGVAVVLVVYFAINLAYVALLGFDGARASSAIGADAAARALGENAQRVFAAMVALSALGILNTIAMAPPFVLMAMADEGLFPRWFARRHPIHGTPTAGVLGQGLWAAFVLVAVHTGAVAASSGDLARATAQTLDFACDGVVFVDWLVYMACGLALLRLRRSGAPSPLALPFVPFAAVLFALGAACVAAAAIATKPWPSLVGAAIVLLGVPFALLVRPASPR